METQKFYFENQKQAITEEESLECLTDKELILLTLELKYEEKKHLQVLLHYVDNKRDDSVYTIPSNSEGFISWKKFIHFKSLVEMCEAEKAKRKH